ncbi:hypothetical protein ACS0TY_012078 [Phlomoides rotata]
MEMSLLILYFFLLFIFIILMKQYTKSRNPGILPPGPWKLPLLGNVHQLIGSLPHHALNTLAQKHGPLMFIRLGELPVIIVSSPKIAKEITKTNDVAFADRVELMLAKIVLYNLTDIASTPYGEYWRLMRKLCVIEFLSPKKVRSLYSLMEDEVLHLVDSIQVSEGLTGNSRACFQRSRISDHDHQRSYSDPAVFNVADFFPTVFNFLHFLSAGSKKR